MDFRGERSNPAYKTVMQRVSGGKPVEFTSPDQQFGNSKTWGGVGFLEFRKTACCFAIGLQVGHSGLFCLVISRNILSLSRSSCKGLLNHCPLFFFPPLVLLLASCAATFMHSALGTLRSPCLFSSRTSALAYKETPPRLLALQTQHQSVVRSVITR